MSSTRRLHGLDFLRALMMSLGLVLHSAQMYMVNPVVDYYWDPSRSMTMDVVLFLINTFRMPVFFLLSGFFTAMLLARRGQREMFRNRYQRILLPFLLFLPPLALIMTGLRILARHVMATGEPGFDLAYVESSRELWDNTHNLWFLYYLILFLTSTRVILALCRRLPPRGATTMRRPVDSLSIMIPVCLALAWLGSMHWAGRVSGNLSFVPHLDVYVYFGICFALGWLMQQRMDDLVILGDRWTRYIAIASGLFLVALFSLLLKGAPEEPGYLPLHAVLSLATGFSVGYYMLAFVGLFSRHCSAYNPWVRYFSDSAYWIFIFHSIPLVLLALALYPLAIAAEWKFLIVTTGTLTICLVSYQLFVRNGWIGEVLNGRRYETVPWIRRT